MSGNSRHQPPEGVERLDEATVSSLVPRRAEDGHKGTHGTLLAVCGSLDYTGAALLAGAAALRAGCGLVVLAVPASLQPVVAGRVPELITMALPEQGQGLVDPDAAIAAIAARSHDALLVGPGLKTGDATTAMVRGLLDASTGGGPPLAIDAGALNVLAATPAWSTRVGGRCVLTPHPGEMARLDGEPASTADEVRVARARAGAARWGQVVVLKGARTIVAAPDGRCAMATFSNPALGTGGTGDVLAGTVASLLAQGVEPWDAARLGVFLHGTAGEHVRERLGDAGLLASDLLPELPRVRRHLVRERERIGGERRLGFGTPRAGDGAA